MAWEDDAACWEKVLKHFFMMMSRKKTTGKKHFQLLHSFLLTASAASFELNFYFTTNSERKIKLLFIFLVWLMIAFYVHKALQSSHAFSSDIAFLSVIACVILMSFNGQLSFWLYLSASLLSEFCEHFLKLFYALKIEFFLYSQYELRGLRAFCHTLSFLTGFLCISRKLKCDKIKIYALSL